MKRVSALTQRFFTAGCLLLLTNCGFLTAPVGLAGAEAASSTVKAADVSLDSSKKAAIYVRDRSVQGYEISSEFVQQRSVQGYEFTADLVNDFASFIRSIANWRDSTPDTNIETRETATTVIVRQANDEE